MDYRQAVDKLCQLRATVEEYRQIISQSSDRNRQLLQDICVQYGEVEEIYTLFAGKRKVVVQDAGQMKEFPNFFEAGYYQGEASIQEMVIGSCSRF